jgi:CheY-like chemotaxis protein
MDSLVFLRRKCRARFHSLVVVLATSISADLRGLSVGYTKEHPMLSSPFVLVVETSITLRTIIDVFFHQYSYPAGWAIYEEAASALRDIQAGRLPIPDVALLGWDLPKLDGIATTRFMRARGYATAIVLLLEQQSTLDQLKARLAGANTTLVKPFTVQSLLQTLSSFSLPSVNS